MLQPLHAGGRQAIGTAEQHQVRRLELIVEQRLQITEVIQAGVGPPLGLEGRWIAHHTALGERFTIHHGHHTGDAGSRADVRPLKRLHQGNRKGETTGLHHDAVELIGPLQQGLHGGQEFILHGAAQTAIGQFHHPTLKVVLFVLGADTAAADQVTIDAHLPKFIDQHGEPQPAGQQQVA